MQGKNENSNRTSASLRLLVYPVADAQSLGIQLRQMWRATLDGRTRHAYRLLDGQMVDIGEKFKVDGYELEYPGDPSAPRASKLEDLSYEDWKAGKDLQLQKVQKEEEKQRKVQLNNEENRAILKAKIDSGEIPLKVNKG